MTTAGCMQIADISSSDAPIVRGVEEVQKDVPVPQLAAVKLRFMRICAMRLFLPSQKLVRGSNGIELVSFNVKEEVKGQFGHPRSTLSPSENCRVIAFSCSGSLVAWCDGESVQVVDMYTATLKCTLPKPKTRCLQFSPLGTYLALWEPYAAQKGHAGQPNLEVWDVQLTEKVTELIQKRQNGWCPQWTEDEKLCSRNVTNEVHCFEQGRLGVTVSNKLVVEGLSSYALSPSEPYKIAVYVPGSKGAPSFVRMYQYPKLKGAGSVVASRSFYRADEVKFCWNKKGSAVLVVTTTDVDKTGSSYYGEQGLLYLSARGDGNLVILDKKGPIYDVQWNPNSEEFCVLYGFMPCKATLFNNNSDPIHDFGTGHRNLVQFNPHGNILCLAGFGNLRGNMFYNSAIAQEFWDRKSLTLLSKPQASDSTHFQWCPDGVHVVTATTAPRLRVGNGFKLWHFKGSLLFQEDTPPKHELWEVCWCPRPISSFPIPDVTVVAPPSIAATSTATAQRAAAYVPPALRGKPRPAEGSTDQQETGLSKSVQKNRRKKQHTKPQEVMGGRSQEQKGALSVATHLMGGASIEGGGDNEKRIKNLKKKLRQIEQLKQQQAEGAKLELNQLEKIKMEESLRGEIETLERN